MHGAETIGSSRIWSTTVIYNTEHLADAVEAVLVDHRDLEGNVEFLTRGMFTWGQLKKSRP